MDLSKISQKIWQVVVLSVGILFLLGVLVTVVGIGFSVYQYKVRHVEGIAVGQREDRGRLKVTVEYGLPLPLEELDFFIIPVTLEKREQGQEREGVLGEVSSYSYDKMGLSYPSYSYWGPYCNLVFIDKKTGESRTILAEKGFIKGVYFPEKRYEDKKDAEIKPTFLLLNIAVADTNGDGLINEQDASAGFVASLDGRKLTQITPDYTQMRWWAYDEGSKRLFVEIIQDVNRDKKFNWDDPKTVVSVNVLDPAIGQDCIPAETKNKIESVLLEK